MKEGIYLQSGLMLQLSLDILPRHFEKTVGYFVSPLTIMKGSSVMSFCCDLCWYRNFGIETNVALVEGGGAFDECMRFAPEFIQLLLSVKGFLDRKKI